MMTRTPPNRRGITFEIGAPLEARDSLKNWYAASIEKIDFDEERVLIHYRQWSHRYDEWFDWGSPYLRPVERIQLRKEGLRERNVGRGFHVNDKVLASWSDCRFYPARVLSVNKDASYTIKFFDGVIQTVKEIHVKPFHKDTKGGKSKREEKNKDRVESKQEKNRRLPERACVSTENGNIKSKRSARRSTADRSGENGNEEQPTPPVGKAKKDELEVESGKKGCRTVSGVEQGGEKPGAGVGGHGGPAGPQPDRQPADAGKLPELMEVKAEVEISEPSEHLSAGPEPLSREASHQNQGRQTRLAEGGTEPEHDILELRKRKICLGQTAPVKRSRLDSSSDKAVPVESKLAKSDAATTKRETPDVEDQTETARPPVEKEAAPVVRRAQQPNPNKYSREPLYRVVKNQPPPVLSINLDHNPFKCKAPGCLKSFRKAKLLHYHVKYYHDGDQSAMAGLGSPRSVQTRASERQDVPPESPRTRRTPSTPLSSSTHSVHRATHPSRTGKPNERKRVLTPPSGSTGNHSQVSLHENSRENLEKMRFRAFQREQNATDAVTKERVNEARLKDFLRIRLKKRRRMRKKKKPKSDEDSCSDWSTDSMMWSTEELEEELGVELDTAQGGTTVAQGSDIVRCICKVQEEDDFMIQCEECLSWQHGACMGLMEDNVPERYACYICRYLPGQRRSLHYRHDSDWLSRGHMYGLSFLEENYSDRNAAKITAAHQLLGDVHHVIEVLSGLQLKINILQSQSHPDLKLWCQPWKRVEKPRKRAVPPSVVTNDGLDRGGAEEASRTSARDSYISSEHCYQKPHAYYPATEQRLVVETRDSELEDSLRSTEDLLTLEHRYGVPPELDGGKVDRPARAKKADGCGKQSAERGSEVKSEAMPPGEMEWQWQVNLLDHIEAVQEEVTSRMDFIEKELDVLESWLDHTGELEPPEPLARLPQLKLRIKQLLADLGKVQQIALCCST